MKKFVILGYIYGIGGWQTYINNKLKLMKANGWEVYAINNGMSRMVGCGMLTGLEIFQNNDVYTLCFPYPSEVGDKLRHEVIMKIGRLINYEKDDEIIFEATLLDLFMWAEFLAKQFKGRAICVEVSNRFRKYCNSTLDFFYFKEKRGELMMMSKTGLYELFNGYIDYPKIDINNVGALTQDEYEDDGKDYVSLLKTDKANFVIGTVGWLDKGYYKILIDEVIKFAKRHPDKKVQFIVIGNSKTGDIESDYKRKAKQASNVVLNMMGAIAPIPSNLVKLFDVSVASYGCATITDKLGVKTIVMHDPDPIPLGILSYTITEPPIQERVNFDKSISDMFEDILVNDFCNKHPYTAYKSISIDKQGAKHLMRLNQVEPKLKYFNIEHLPNSDVSNQHKVKVLLVKIFGEKFIQRLCK